MPDIEKKLKRLERIQQAIKEFKLGYDCAKNETLKAQQGCIEAEVEQFFEHILDIYLEG